MNVFLFVLFLLFAWLAYSIINRALRQPDGWAFRSGLAVWGSASAAGMAIVLALMCFILAFAL